MEKFVIHTTWISYNGGHIQAGSFMVIYGLWMMVNVYYYYNKALWERTKYTSTVTYPFACCTNRFNCRRFPWDGMIKMVLALSGVIFHVFLINGFRGDMGIDTREESLQHISMFSAFLISSIIDLFVYFRLPLPSSIDKLALTGAFCNELLLFMSHNQSKMPYEAAIHQPFSYIISATCISLLLEIKLPKSVLASLSRAYFTILQGTWFWQASYFMFYSTYAYMDYSLLIMAYFSFHAFVIFAVTIGLGILTKFIVKFHFGKRGEEQFSNLLLSDSE